MWPFEICGLKTSTSPQIHALFPYIAYKTQIYVYINNLVKRRLLRLFRDSCAVFRWNLRICYLRINNTTLRIFDLRTGIHKKVSALRSGMNSRICGFADFRKSLLAHFFYWYRSSLWVIGVDANFPLVKRFVTKSPSLTVRRNELLYISLCIYL